tara:strand:- start:3800 stop:4741 length:942 start_codon:yes stop_codon:yes gene_type:complete
LSTKPVIVVGGPTASGKSGLALGLAQRVGGQIINADSMQVYRDLQVITARPSLMEQGGVPHHLYGVLGRNDRNSAGIWRQNALEIISGCHRANKVPFLVGGTGLYLRALMTGLHRMPSVPAEFRYSLNQRLRLEGPTVLHRELSEMDPGMAKRLHPADGQRIVRALEIFLYTGKRLSDWQIGETEAAPKGLRFFTIVILPERDILYHAINERFDRMLNAGAIEEVKRMLAAGPKDDYPPLRAVGVPPIRSFLDGVMHRDRMIDTAKRDTRRYAKRQETWFRHQIIPDIVIQTKYSEISLDKIFPDISKFLLTD